MNEIKHFLLPENSNKLYTNEAISSISLTREVSEKINEIVDAFNALNKDDMEWKHENEGRIRKAVIYMKDNLVNSLQDLLDALKNEGFIDERIQENMKALIDETKELTGRLDNIVSAVTVDSEVIDIRVDTKGKALASAGAQVRKIEELVNGILSNNMNIYQGLNWVERRAINTSGNVYTAGSENFKVASIALNKGAKISYCLYSNEFLPVIATGYYDKPVTIIDSVPELGDSSKPVIGTYEVLNDCEVIWFSTTKLQDDNAYIYVTLPTDNILSWTKQYINTDGLIVADNVYGLSAPIFVKAGQKISASLMASDAVSAISMCDENGTFIEKLRVGKNGAIINTYEYYATEDCYVRVCSRINGNGNTMSVNNVNIKIEDIPKFYTPTFSIGNGHINVDDSNVRNDGVYMYSDLIYLDKGMTIRFYSSGSNAMWCLSEWNDNREFVAGIVQGDTRHKEITYTATKNMIVRISAKKVQSGTEAVTTEEEFTDVKIYLKDKYYEEVKNNVLYGKSITFFGDSLAYGNIIGQDATWCHLLSLKYNMEETNLGINGNTVAVQGIETTNRPMVTRYTDIPESDYIVIIGGANDKRLNVAIADFESALESIIDGVRNNHPKAKILFLTNYNRFPDSPNTLGLNDIDYVESMIKVCREKGVKCFDNYHDSGVTFADWFDEGVAQGTTANKHISKEGYKWLVPLYESILGGM
jgi:hypothetical protein